MEFPFAQLKTHILWETKGDSVHLPLYLLVRNVFFSHTLERQIFLQTLKPLFPQIQGWGGGCLGLERTLPGAGCGVGGSRDLVVSSPAL